MSTLIMLTTGMSPELIAEHSADLDSATIAEAVAALSRHSSAPN